MNRNYGSGMPSAIVKDVDGPNNATGEQIWLYYYDSGGGFPPWGTGWQLKLAKSWDGFHFDPPVTMRSAYGNVPQAFEIKYLDIPVNNKPGVYIGTNDPWGYNWFAYSYDSLNWVWPNVTSLSDVPNWSVFNMGLVNPRMCGSPGVNALVGDKHGILNSLNVSYLSGEGYYSPLEGWSTIQQCDQQPESQQETISRGSTWDLFYLTGQFIPAFGPTPPPPSPTPAGLQGDLNGDRRVNIFDLNILVGDYGKTGNSGFIASDINRDGAVNGLDYVIVIQNMGAIVPPTPTPTRTPTPTLTSTPTRTPTPTPTPRSLQWNFNTNGNSEGWYTDPNNGQNSQQTVAGGVMKFQILGADSNFMYNNVPALPAQANQTLSVRYKIDYGGVVGGNFYWIVNNQTLVQDLPNHTGDGQWRTLDIPVGSFWGMTRPSFFRIDMANSPTTVGANFEIDWIKLSPVP